MAEREMGMKGLLSILQDVAGLTIVAWTVWVLFYGSDIIEAAVLAVRAGL